MAGHPWIWVFSGPGISLLVMLLRISTRLHCLESFLTSTCTYESATRKKVCTVHTHVRHFHDQLFSCIVLSNVEQRHFLGLWKQSAKSCRMTTVALQWLTFVRLNSRYNFLQRV